MTDAQCAAALAAIYPHMRPTADRMLALIDEVERLRRIEAAGERIVDICRSTHFVERISGNSALADALGTAMDTWIAAHRDTSIP